MKSAGTSIILATVMIAALGGGGGHDASVEGVVTLDGQPLTRGTVSFIPDAGGAGATAAINSDGTFAAKTGSSSGLPPGEYSITVRAREDAVIPAKGNLPMPGKLLTPKKYDAASTSGLRATIEPGDNELKLELQSDAA